jgi:hypothetical protein
MLDRRTGVFHSLPLASIYTQALKEKIDKIGRG